MTSSVTEEPDDRLARVALSRLGEPGSTRIAAWVAQRSAPEVWTELFGRLRAAADRGEAPPPPGLAEAERDLAALERLGGRLVLPSDPEWPVLLHDLDSGRFVTERALAGPLALFVRGQLRLGDATASAVAVVGSREGTAYGLAVAGELGVGLAEAGWTTVSGGAYGIDAAAHRGALAGSGVTVAVLAGGPDVLYPAGNRPLLERIVAEGVVASEVPPGLAPTRRRFLVRNRLIAALTRGTVLVEAGWRSGARNTVGHARALGRAVMAVPGPVTSALSAGCHGELREPDAQLVTGAHHVLEEVGPVGTLAPLPATRAGPRDGLGSDAAAVLEAVPARSPRPTSSIAKVSGRSEMAAGIALAELEILGLVTRSDAGWHLTDAGRRPAAG